ncbi:unnamed protein product, partial [Porites evermanni]
MTLLLVSLGISGKRGQGESEVSESERILNRAGRIDSAYDVENQIKQESKDKPVTMLFPMLCNCLQACMYGILYKLWFLPYLTKILFGVELTPAYQSRTVQAVPDLFDKKYLNTQYDELLEICAKVDIEITSEQVKINAFFRHRAGRIEASISKQACQTNPAQPSHSRIKTICYPHIFRFSNVATEHGCKNEKQALAAYELAMKERHVNFKVKECGILMLGQYVFAGMKQERLLFIVLIQHALFHLTTCPVLNSQERQRIRFALCATKVHHL